MCLLQHSVKRDRVLREHLEQTITERDWVQNHTLVSSERLIQLRDLKSELVLSLDLVHLQELSLGTGKEDRLFRRTGPIEIDEDFIEMLCKKVVEGPEHLAA